jgi:hypothetical protein
MTSFLFPGIPTTADGSEAVVWVETHITQGACAYPITPSTNMGGGYQLAVANGQKNLWGEPLAFLELESEHSSASRTFPLFTYDPRKGERIRERLSLVGNPAQKEDWWTPPKSDKPFTFCDFARTEGRFAKQFDKEGLPSEMLLLTQEDGLRNWRMLPELAGLR